MSILKFDKQAILVEHVVGWEEGIFTRERRGEDSVKLPFLLVFLSGGKQMEFRFYDWVADEQWYIPKPEEAEKFIRKLEKAVEDL